MFNIRLLVIVTVLIASCAGLGILRLDIDTDVARSLPKNDRVIADGLEIFAHHPIHDQVAVDITVSHGNADILGQCAAYLEEEMKKSGLFESIGNESLGEEIQALALHAARNLPLLFSREELQEIEPLLTPERIRERLAGIHQDLSSLEGIGQAEFISTDPLGLKDLILAKMALLAPTPDSRLYQGRPLSADGRHLLVTAKPLAAGTDTASARSIAALFARVEAALDQRYAPEGREVTLTPVGAFRAALDNERIIRHDVEFALLLATGGIALLLFLSFSRPLMGLLCLVPALAGTAAALLVYSLFHPAISIMVLGFGGAIISITVDHGIAYLLFLDLPRQTRGRDASLEVKAVGFMAVVTTVVAFLILSLSGFPIFTQLGQFTALGIFFSFLFVHTVFPRIFPVMPAGRSRRLSLQSLVNLLYSCGWPGALAALLTACVLAFFARPVFQVNLESMNTVSEKTRAADELFAKVWGNIGDRVFLMKSAPGLDALQQENDRTLERLEEDRARGIVEEAFVPSLLFPGSERAAANLGAWNAFWDRERVSQVRQALRRAGSEFGFTTDAFAPFFAQLAGDERAQSLPIPGDFFELLAISGARDTTGLIQFITVVPGQEYDAEAFLARYGENNRIFDADYFTGRLADNLFSTFATMLVIIAVSVALLLFAVSLNPTLTLLTLLPAGFALVCTLGTLRLLGQPLDIPALMLSIIIFGMGIDYAIFCVRAHQRYRDKNHPLYARVRCSVFLAGTSTLIGFGVLALADHSLLKSIGITSFLGVAYCLLGTFLLLPPLLDLYFTGTGPKQAPLVEDPARGVRRRFRTLEPYPRMFARGKLRFDPMFRDLPGMLKGGGEVRTILDIGCGYAVPACWLLERYPSARIAAMDPDPERVRVARLVLGERGTVSRGWAPELPDLEEGPADLVLLLDMLHYLDTETVGVLFRRCRAALGRGGLLVARFVIEPQGSPSWSWRLEEYRIKAGGGRSWYRRPEEMAGLLEEAGFEMVVNRVAADNPELVWQVARVVEG